MPAASVDAVLIPELPSPGMLMTDGTHSATGITVIDGRLILLRPPVAVVAPGAFQLARRGGLRATADLSKRTIVAGHGPACLASQIPAIADGPGRGRPGQRLRSGHCWVSTGKCRAFTRGLCGFLFRELRIKTRTALGIKTRSGN